MCNINLLCVWVCVWFGKTFPFSLLIFFILFIFYYSIFRLVLIKLLALPDRRPLLFGRGSFIPDCLISFITKDIKEIQNKINFSYVRCGCCCCCWRSSDLWKLLSELYANLCVLFDRPTQSNLPLPTQKKRKKKTTSTVCFCYRNESPHLSDATKF